MKPIATTAIAGALVLAASWPGLAQVDPAAPTSASGGLLAQTQGQPSPTAPRFSPDQVVQGLTAMGYSDVSIVSQDGGTYLARGKKNGRDVTLLVDPAGQVQERAGG